MLRPASIRSRASDSTRALVRSVTSWSRLAFVERRSFRARSRLRAENQEIKARNKKPKIAGIFGTIETDSANKTMITLLRIAKKKLAIGWIIKLAIAMGRVYTNNDRPSANCG